MTNQAPTINDRRISIILVTTSGQRKRSLGVGAVAASWLAVLPSYVFIFSLIAIPFWGVSKVGAQDPSVILQDPPLPNEDSLHFDEFQPAATSHVAELEGGHNDLVCAGDACGNPCGSACLQEQQHLRYLKSYHGGTAQYTHQWNRYQAQQIPWHGRYYHTDWGRPIALVVPPTAQFQTRWSWGVGQTTVIPLYHQFGRPYPGSYESGGGIQFRGTPMWPSHTDQFGVYYVRGPW